MRYLYLLIFFSITIPVSAQNAESDTTEKPRTSLTLATLYSSNISYYGQTSGDKLPYVLGYASLNFPSGVSISGQTYKLFNQQGISGVNVTLGYDFNLTKNLSGGLSYGRSFYPDSSQLLQSVNEDMASATLVYDWKWLRTGLVADYGIGQQDVFYTTFNASKVIDLGLSLTSKDYFTLEPVVEVVGGTQVFYTTVEDTSPPPPGDGDGGLIEEIPIFGKKGKPLRNPRKLPSGDNNESKTVATTSFDVLSYTFSLPIVYNRSNYYIEASYQGSVLSKAVSNSQKLQSFFNLGFYYTF